MKAITIDTIFQLMTQTTHMRNQIINQTDTTNRV